MSRANRYRKMANDREKMAARWRDFLKNHPRADNSLRMSAARQYRSNMAAARKYRETAEEIESSARG